MSQIEKQMENFSIKNQVVTGGWVVGGQMAILWNL
jgi:hypothetical protein